MNDEQPRCMALKGPFQFFFFPFLRTLIWYIDREGFFFLFIQYSKVRTELLILLID